MNIFVLQAEAIFDSRKRVWHLEDEAHALLQKAIFGSFDLAAQTTGGQKELVLTQGSKSPLPFMVWSAGQREFVPLLLAMMWLLPGGPARQKQSPDWVVIEEPEMGLHPQAVSAVLVVILQILARGYRVIVSTHSTHVLDLVWALQVFRRQESPPAALLDLFEVKRRPKLLQFASRVLEKKIGVYYFDPLTRETQDISTLDPNDRDPNVNSWGGLTDFANQVGDVIAKQVGDNRAE